MNRFIACIAAALYLIPTTSLAQDNADASKHAVQCLVAGSELVASDDPKMKTAGLIMSTFFAGEAFGIDPDIDLTAAVKSATSGLTPDGVKALLGQCGAELGARGKQITAAGAGLSGVATSQGAS